MWTNEERSLGLKFLNNDQPSLAFDDVVSFVMRRMKHSSDSRMKRLAHLLEKYDVQNISPRKMQQLCRGLHNLKLISDCDYFYLSFQPDTHPNYNETIGKYYGRTASPDEPRDMIGFWEERAIDMNASEGVMKGRAERMLKILLHYNVLRHAISSPEKLDGDSLKDESLLS